MWPEEAILYFQQYSNNEQVQIRIVSLHSGKNDPSLPHIVDAILKKQSINSPQSLAAILIEKDLAKTIKLKDLERALIRQFCPSHDSKSTGNSHCSDCNVNFNSKLNGPAALVDKDIKSQPLHENQRGLVKTSSSLSPKVKSNNLEINKDPEWQRNKDIEKCFELGHNLLLSRRVALYRSENKDVNTAMPIVLPDIEIQVMLSNVVSPSSLFVHCATEETGKTLDHLREKMMTLSKSELRLRSKNFTPIKNSLCCAVCSLDGQLYRGLVLESYQEPADAQNHEIGKVLIFFIDYGDFEWVSHSNVFPLPEELKKIRPMVLWCTLANVKPQLHNTESVTKQHTQAGWPSHVVEEFKAMICTQDILYTIITENSALKITECDGFQLEPLPIYLLDRNGPQEMCLNYELIELGLATVNTSCQIPASGDSVMPAGGDSAMPDSYTAKSSELDEWEPMFEDYTSLRNSYNVDIDDAGVALVGYSAAQGAKDRRRVCAYFNKSSGCKRGVNCPNLHVKVQDADTTYDKVPVLMFDEDQTLLLPQHGSYCNVTVTNVKSLSQFYVNLHGGPVRTHNSNIVEACLEEESLNGLMANMQKYYKTSIYYDGDLTLLAPGQAVAAKIRGIWMRAKVIDTDVEGCLVQVMSVDYGNLEWVNERDIRELQLQFIHLTPQAVECALSDFVPKDEFEGWTCSACNAFAKLVMGKPIVLQVKYRYPTGLIGVSLYDSSRNDIRESLLDYGLISNSIRNSEMEAVSQQFSDTLREFLYMPG
ncbi:unnamed protein product [Lymnaea stagnalis]|uniref:Uncharacterized protein n=1 Tax=Lymnaea stagnalis TaxID=6523 RepID=A0AAV2HKL7_LYMST